MTIKKWTALLIALMMLVSIPVTAENLIAEPAAETDEMTTPEPSEGAGEPEIAGQGETPLIAAEPEGVPETEAIPEAEETEAEDPENPVTADDSATETPDEDGQTPAELPEEIQGADETKGETVPETETEPTAEYTENPVTADDSAMETPDEDGQTPAELSEEIQGADETKGEAVSETETEPTAEYTENPEPAAAGDMENPEPAGDPATEKPEEEQPAPAEAQPETQEEAAVAEAPTEEQKESAAQLTTAVLPEPKPIPEPEAPIPETPERQAGEPCEVLAITDQHDVLKLSNYANASNIEGFVYRMYKTVLGREPEEEGFHYWVNLLESGTFTAADVVHGFFNSVEYQNAGKTNEEIVKDCYYTMLNRLPDEPGYKFWNNRLNIGMTYESIIAGFVESDEFTRLANNYGVRRGTIEVSNPRDLNYNRTYFVYRLYQNCLGRKPDLDGEEHWCRMLADGMTGAQVASGFFFSDEFNKNRYNNSSFVQLLYKTILGREYDVNGLIDWVTKLNYAETREKVLNGFIGSEEFRGQCVTAQINPGDPISTPDDTEEWQYNIKVLRLCNQQRREAGLADLYTREDLLWDLAMTRAKETTEQFSHTRPNGTSCFTLFKQQGFYGYLGENLAAGMPYQDPAAVVEAWMNSQGHRENIMNPNFTYLATGYVYDPDAMSYCAEGKYTGQYVNFGAYAAQSFCNYGVKIK